MKNDLVYLVHIRDCVEKILKYTAIGRDGFLANPMLQDAVIRNFEIIGEATKRVSEETKSLQPDVDWRKISRFRDVLIHHYMGVNLEAVWEIVEINLPSLQQAVSNLLETLE